ncbi:hypothetical protein QF037_009753 [Streptomyces canus]|nr:hypothetical protein [Streptomyces canus]
MAATAVTAAMLSSMLEDQLSADQPAEPDEAAEAAVDDIIDPGLAPD